ncbi:MAG: metallophosphoesterase, partial [Bacteroidales bacterium]|nr:metallophosphoesterase [Bacteroidales bacterium]
SVVGTENEIMDFLEWFLDLPYKYKIFIGGNHDHGLHNAKIDGLPENCHHLSNSGVTIEGIKFYGVPLFMEDIEAGDLDTNIRKIPADTDVLITHQPPYCILDLSGGYNWGDRILLETVLKTQPKFHLFGHIHGAYGIEKNNNTTFVNAAILDEHLEIAYEPVLLEI